MSILGFVTGIDWNLFSNPSSNSIYLDGGSSFKKIIQIFGKNKKENQENDVIQL